MVRFKNMSIAHYYSHISFIEYARSALANKMIFLSVSLLKLLVHAVTSIEIKYIILRLHFPTSIAYDFMDYIFLKVMKRPAPA